MPHHRDAIIDLENLEQLSRAELRALWTEELAEKPPASLGRDILVLGVAYARQERGATAGSPSRSPKKSTGCWHVCSATATIRPSFQPNHCRELAPFWCASGREQPTTSP